MIMRRFDSVHRFLWLPQQVISNCVSHLHEHNAWTHIAKGEKGQQGWLKRLFQQHRKPLLAQEDTFFAREWPLSITMSRTKPEIWRYSHLLVDYFNQIPLPLLSLPPFLGFHRGLSGGRVAGNPSCLVRCRVSGTQHLSEAPHKSPQALLRVADITAPCSSTITNTYI